MTEMKTILILMIGVLSAHGQLSVTVSPPKITGQKAVVPLALKNSFSEKIESARAAVFLLDEQGRMAAQETRWVIDGSNTNGLAAGATNAFHFVITSDKSFTTTNLTAKVTFSRVVLEGGKVADVAKDVQIQNTGK
jgi:hypothetical protein